MTILLAAVLWSDLAFWSAVVSVLLYGLLVAVGSKPLKEAMGKRQEGIRQGLEQASIALEEVAKIREQQRMQRERSAEQAKELIAEAGRDAVRMQQEIKERAATEAEKLKARAERETRLATQNALHELWTTASNQSSQLAERLVSASLQNNDHDRLIERSIGRIGSTQGSRS